MKARSVIGCPIDDLPSAERRVAIEQAVGTTSRIYELRAAGMRRRLWLVVRGDVVAFACWHVRDLVTELRREVA